MKTRKVSILAASLVGAALAAGVGLGFAQEDAKPGAAEKAGGALDNLGRRIKRGAGDAADSVREGFARTKEGVHSMGVESRIYGRLHWDKTLTNAQIQLEVQAGGVAVLKGSVPDAAAKAKAETLAAETVGVTKVVNQLALAPPSATTTTTTTTTTTERTKAPAPKPVNP